MSDGVIRDGVARECLYLLVRRDGPLTVKEVAAGLSALHGGVVLYGQVAPKLKRLVALGYAETMHETLLGHRSRIYWPTPEGRRALDDQRRML